MTKNFLPGEFAQQLMVHGVSRSLFSINEHNPRKYVAFAEDDVRDKDPQRGPINAVSNAKRALHMQLELLCGALGFEQWKPRGNYPSRVDFLTACGIHTPELLDRLNRFRNEVEHDYVVPTRDQARDIVDVVDLYIRATDKYAGSFQYARQVYLGPWEVPPAYCLSTEIGSGRIELYRCDLEQWMIKVMRRGRSPSDAPATAASAIAPELTSSIGEPNYFGWVRVLLAIGS